MSELRWQKSSYSGGGTSGECVEVAPGPDGLLHIRESDAPDVTLVVSGVVWGAFLRGIKAG
ncbi:DUF397 domain-containing protein [Streptomyces zagrosensis]|uniref:DUF397 domain-containing protein n=1 Tax=Streptomyces zagrosensis TaxID=1042984 RepID=A0A7W9UZC5_9ACTN|nr:DUF397 domain-containing protein [Streptomyces zagrosensis]MBB5936858.1 hypothetical protein [Streptomyces zagrosensis]